MAIRHEPWNSRLIDQLDELRIQVPVGNAGMIGDHVTESLRLYGFALLSGLGEGNGRETAANELTGLASSLGEVVPQSPRGEKVEDVRDFSDVEVKDERGYRSGGELSPHSDPPTLIALHCLKSAKAGGESYLVNVRSIHDRIAEVDAQLLDELFQGFPHWRPAGEDGVLEPGPAPYRRPVFARRDDTISCVYYRPFIERGAEESGEQLSELQIAALDLFDRCAGAPDLALRFLLQPGETMVLHNRAVLHARTDYEDWPEPERRRHLLRVWIDAPDRLPVAPEHELGDLFAKAT
jgi:hypothetical protein